MPLFLSASSIKDFIDCPKRFQYRTLQKEQGITNDNMLVGTIVHEILEKYWDNKELAQLELNKQLAFFGLRDTKILKANGALDLFFNVFSKLLTKDDEIEYKFKLTLEKDVFLVGKMDRISMGNIFDWKTDTSPPREISKDIQFIIYTEAYRRIFGKEPIATYYASLSTGKLIKLKTNKALTKNLFNDIIPAITQSIKQKLYYQKGIYTNNCRLCPFKQVCYEEMEYVVDS